MHFYAPVWRRTMVELMRGRATSDETIECAHQFARSIGMTPLLVRKESTGFIFNRVWRAIKKECLHLVNDGVASHEDVDRAWMIFTGTSMGPFGNMDMIGLDVIRDIEMVYYTESGDASDAPPELLLEKIARGELGAKTGKGFYTYPDPAFQDPRWLSGSDD
jgi:3-hydroxybutyryl-CoA dehydrogenase